MRHSLVTLCGLAAALISITAMGQNETEETIEQKAERINRAAIICDLHADTFTAVRVKKLDFLKGSKGLQIDLPKLRAGNIAMTTQALWVLNKGLNTTPYKHIARMLDLVDVTLMDEAAADLALVRNYTEFEAARKAGKIAVTLTIEDGRAVEGDVEKLREFYQRGVRGMSLTWNMNNDLATSAWEVRHRKGQGLTGKGKEIIREMATLGIMIDVSHLSNETVRDILKTTDAPIYASHSCVYKLNPHWRNIKDWQIQAVADRGGVVGINFYSKHLRKDGKVASAVDVVKHIDYVVKLVGVDYVAIGSDFDGDIDSTKDLENISKMSSIIIELLKKGYSEEDIKKILGGNYLRYFRRVCP